MKAYLHSKRGRNTPHDFDDGYGIDCIIMISLFPCNVCNRLTLENIGYVGTSIYQMIGRNIRWKACWDYTLIPKTCNLFVD